MADFVEAVVFKTVNIILPKRVVDVFREAAPRAPAQYVEDKTRSVQTSESKGPVDVRRGVCGTSGVTVGKYVSRPDTGEAARIREEIKEHEEAERRLEVPGAVKNAADRFAQEYDVIQREIRDIKQTEHDIDRRVKESEAKHRDSLQLVEKVKKETQVAQSKVRGLENTVAELTREVQEVKAAQRAVPETHIEQKVEQEKEQFKPPSVPDERLPPGTAPKMTTTEKRREEIPQKPEVHEGVFLKPAAIPKVETKEVLKETAGFVQSEAEKAPERAAKEGVSPRARWSRDWENICEVAAETGKPQEPVWERATPATPAEEPWLRREKVVPPRRSEEMGYRAEPEFAGKRKSVAREGRAVAIRKSSEEQRAEEDVVGKIIAESQRVMDYGKALEGIGHKLIVATALSVNDQLGLTEYAGERGTGEGSQRSSRTSHRRSRRHEEPTFPYSVKVY